MFIQSIEARDVRFQLEPGQGTDAIHSTPQYSFAVTLLTLDSGLQGTGLVLTMGLGNDLVCGAIQMLSEGLVGADLEEIMADFGARFRELANEPQLRWLGPHKGVVHLALASITNACFGAWAKARQQPLWKALLDLPVESFVNLLDLSYLEDVLDRDAAISILREEEANREKRLRALKGGYPGYDTSVGWYSYNDDQVRAHVMQSLEEGFGAFKLKVGGSIERDLQRAQLLRKLVGDDRLIMLDANQQWTLPHALVACRELAAIQPFWVEEPTHPDDVEAHRTLAAADAVRLAIGEHVPNRILFKNYLEARCISFLQPDCTRLGGVSEFLTVSLLARKYKVPVVPHVGDMGQIHQHLVLVNHVAMGHDKVFLEHIPHLRRHFVHPAQLSGGLYLIPQEIGNGADLLPAAF